MKTTQILAASAVLFPLAAVASVTSSPLVDQATTTSADASQSTGSSSSSSSWKDLGCYKISSTLTKTGGNLLAPASNPTGFVGSGAFNTKGFCTQDLCSSYKYAASQGSKCFCADEIDTLTLALAPEPADAICNTPCPGYDRDTCGGTEALNVYENKDKSAADGGAQKTTTQLTTLSASGYPTATGGYSNGTGTGTGTSGAPQTTKTGGPVEAGAGSLAGQSVAVLMAVCGAGAALLL